MYKGIDYGNGQTNINFETKIRYGVIPAHDIGQAWYEDSEGNYGNPQCPKCSNDAELVENKPDTDDDGNDFDFDTLGYEYAKHECEDYFCESCLYVFGSESAFPESPNSFEYAQNGYIARQSGDDSDIFILQSPYFTYAQYCSPCAPGACYLRSPLELPDNDCKCYCFGHEWYETGIAPYKVYSVEAGLEVLPE